MMIVSDVNDVFVPLLDGFLVDAKESKMVIERSVEIVNALNENSGANSFIKFFSSYQYIGNSSVISVL